MVLLGIQMKIEFKGKVIKSEYFFEIRECSINILDACTNKHYN